MKIACVYPEKPLWPKMKNVEKAFASMRRHSVVHVQTPAELKQADKEVDLCVFMHKSPGIRWPNLRPIAKSRQSAWVQWWFDLMVMDSGKALRDQVYFKQFRPVLKEMDVVFVKERGLLADYKAEGVNAVYLDQGCPSDIKEINRGEDKLWDVLLWGQSGWEYLQRTKDAGALVLSGIRVAWASNAANFPETIEHLPWTHPDELPFLASKAKCVLSVDLRSDVDGYCSDRFWQACGMGCCVLSRRLQQSSDEPYLYYRNRDELVRFVSETIRLDNYDQMGMRARSWVMAEETIEHKCREVIRLASAPIARMKACSM